MESNAAGMVRRLALKTRSPSGVGFDSSAFRQYWGCSDNGSTSVLQAESRGSIPRFSTKF